MTDRDLAQLELAVYGKSDPHWNYFSGTNGVVWGAKIIDGTTVLAFRGSETILDFWRDLRAIATPAPRERLGHVHPGFLDGMEDAWREIQAHTTPPRVLIGHSLGAARTAILAGLMVLDNRPPAARVVWGEPLSGFLPHADLIRGIPTRSYRNGDRIGHDPITDLPAFRYVRASKLTDVCACPDFGLSPDWRHLWPIGFHDMAMYERATPELPTTKSRLL